MSTAAVCSCRSRTARRTTNGKAMNRTPSHSMVITFVLASSLGLISCTAAPSPSWVDRMEEPRRAAQMVQDRQQELAAFRADMAATRIAAAKKEAELQELRALVTSLRQENGESRQTLLEANRMVEGQHTELAALKAKQGQARPSRCGTGPTGNEGPAPCRAPRDRGDIESGPGADETGDDNLPCESGGSRAHHARAEWFEDHTQASADRATGRDSSSSRANIRSHYSGDAYFPR